MQYLFYLQCSCVIEEPHTVQGISLGNLLQRIAENLDVHPVLAADEITERTFDIIQMNGVAHCAVSFNETQGMEFVSYIVHFGFFS